MATVADEPQRIVPAGCAPAELAWLAGDLEGVERMARPRSTRPIAPATRRLTGEAAFWLWRAGVLGETPPGIEGAYRLSIAGDWAGAARGMGAAGLPLRAGRGALARGRGARPPAGARRSTTAWARRGRRPACGPSCGGGARRPCRGAAPGDAREPAGPHAPPAGGAGPARRGGHERPDRRAPGDVRRAPWTTTWPRCWASWASPRAVTRRRRRAAWASTSPKMGSRRPDMGRRPPMWGSGWRPRVVMHRRHAPGGPPCTRAPTCTWICTTSVSGT